MKVALFSDVYANLPALEACLADMEQKKPDAVYCLGNLVGCNVWPNEVISVVRSRHIPVIAGNFDICVGTGSADCQLYYEKDEDRINARFAVTYTNQIMFSAERKYLRTLPTHMSAQYSLGERLINLHMVHHAPDDLQKSDYASDEVLPFLRASGADILCVGQNPKPFHRIVEEPTTTGNMRFRHIVGTGSVGRPGDGDPRGCYALLTINEYSNIELRNSIHIEFVRFDYDIEQAAKAIEESSLPNAYAEALRKGN